MRELKIIECEEGYVLTYEVQETDDILETCYIPIQEYDGEQDCMKRMLLSVAEHFGCDYDKWSATNVNITFDKKGHKVED